MVEIYTEVEFLPNFYNKTNKKALQQSTEDLVEKLTRELEYYCKLESPVDTGNLRDSHFTRLDGFNSTVGNNAEYVGYVVEGTKYQAPNNFPQRAVNTVLTTTYVRLLFEDFMRYNGIDLER